MRNLFLAALAAVALTVAGGAYAQSQQGGYLGKSPGTQQTASTSPSLSGSHQGGYLGLNHGAQLKPLPPAEEQAAETRMSPRAWCKSSTEPSRCYATAERDHGSCMATSPDHYAACRFALDKMHN